MSKISVRTHITEQGLIGFRSGPVERLQKSKPVKQKNSKYVVVVVVVVIYHVVNWTRL